MLYAIIMMAMYEASKGKEIILCHNKFISNWDFIEIVNTNSVDYEGKFHFKVISGFLHVTYQR